MSAVGSGAGRRDELARLAESMRADLGAVNAAREVALAACRRTIRASGSSIRAVHRLEVVRAQAMAEEARVALREAQHEVEPYSAVGFAGFVHDAAKEYAEAVLTAALVAGGPLPSHTEVGVEIPAWLNGLAEAASELRRHLLDRLREKQLGVAERLLGDMEDVYDLLVTIDYPDAVTGGLRRTADALRAVLERTRSDLTTSILQAQLQEAIVGRLVAEGKVGTDPGGLR
ncbi:MAG: haloacid dehalogenase [Actinomycetota bacterium]|nr:haloacid dehalogenase [Actinomycetota bacterium]